MKVIVLGAGIIGTASAWFLQKAGHEVIVIDRQPRPALPTAVRSPSPTPNPGRILQPP